MLPLAFFSFFRKTGRDLSTYGEPAQPASKGDQYNARLEKKVPVFDDLLPVKAIRLSPNLILRAASQ